MIVLLALVALTGAACGGDDPTVPSSPGPSVPTTVAGTTPPTESPQCDDQSGGTANVVMQDNFFEPDCLIAERSGDLDLKNLGANPHTFTIDNSDVDFELAPGDSQTITGPAPLAPGAYVFYCKFHGSPAGGMKGTITIV
jgi:plastocyanin